MRKNENPRTSRREFLGGAAGAGFALAAGGAFQMGCTGSQTQRRPNILFAISDDQSWIHTGAYGQRAVRTPAFDRVAAQGVLFNNAVSASPGCAPSRAAILTGRTPWQLEEAGTHAAGFSTSLQVFPDLLEAAGYHVGLTGKGAGPANWKGSGWKRNPAGPSFDAHKAADAAPGISKVDYAANFEEFLQKKPQDTPFSFWYGGSEPHRVFEKGAGLKAGKKLEDAVVPPFLPDTPEIRSDILDYYVEIEYFDMHLGRMLDALEKAGELQNTLVFVTSDNGMAFPGAKATMYEYGIHLPLAVSCPAMFQGGRKVDDMVSFTDFAPTFLEAAGVTIPELVTGKSLLPVLKSNKSGTVDPARTSALSGRERHSHARFDNLGYPARAIRTQEYLYIRNFKPDRNPAGDPEDYYDIDDSPTKQYMMKNRKSDQERRLFEHAFGKQPEESLFDIRKDPGCLDNLAKSAEHAGIKEKLRTELDRTLTAQKDPRMMGTGDIWESYPRYSPMRPKLGGFAEQGAYNPKYKPS